VWGTPARALAALLAIEAGLGRRRRERWGPRTLDLDLIDGAGWAPAHRGGFGARPTLPHPRAADRPFVLVPWAEVAPAWPAPVGTPRVGGEAVATVADLARARGGVGVAPAPPAEAAAWRTAVAAVLSRPRAAEAAEGRG
jgi:7,8-dihydro-6-hydroxymethylpterin-pyrophosphokinase